jgi:phosphomannose isomerase type I-like protein
MEPERVHRFGSVTVALIPRRVAEEGLSGMADGRLLRDAIETDPVGWLGEAHVTRFGHSTGLLVKLLDTAQRLPVHAHPDRAFAAEQLSSQFGKKEAWRVVATRQGRGDVWVGLAATSPSSKARRRIPERPAHRGGRRQACRRRGRCARARTAIEAAHLKMH